MPDLPVMLNVRDRRCVVIGGGPVARRRAAALLAAGATVTVIAPQLDLSDLPVTTIERAWQPGDLAGAFLVVIATDDPAVNAAAANEARQAGALVNRADDPAAGDLLIPAHRHEGPITLAVHTGGISPAAAAAIRDELAAALDRDWITLLETIAPYRARIQETIADPAERRRRLTQLASPDALAALRTGGANALQKFCEQVLDSLHHPS